MSVINTNLNALVSQESSRASNLKLSRSMERLSTGLRINSAKDDAAGLAITNRMTAQVRGIQMAIKNSNDAISMSQTAEGAYGQVGNILQRMRELAVQSASGTMSASDRSSIQLEVDQLKEEINQHRGYHQLQQHQAVEWNRQERGDPDRREPRRYHQDVV